MAIIYPIGSTENDSERRAIHFFQEQLPDQYLLFHNLEIPTFSGFAYEYDLIIIGEYAVYVIEVKGYRGVIRGNASEWEFIQTGDIQRSPIPLVNKKARVLASHLRTRDPRLKGVWVQSLIVLTDDKAQIQLRDAQSGKVLHLAEAVTYIQNPTRLDVRTQANNMAPLKQLVKEIIYEQAKPLHRERRIREYQVLEVMERNTFYTFMLAQHQVLTKGRFTLKIYDFDAYATSSALAKERRLIQRDAEALYLLLEHPNIVRVHLPFYWESNRFVLPLEWVNGYSLRGLLDEGIHFDWTRTMDIAIQICEGLRHVHNHGILHRDIRPENIIIPDEGPIKLVNFDCARIEGSQTIASQLDSRLDQRYVAPEIWLKVGKITPAADQYAVGAVIFELLTGAPPCERIEEVFDAGGLPRLPTQVVSTLPPQVDAIISKMCALEPEERYFTWGEIVGDLSTMII